MTPVVVTNGLGPAHVAVPEGRGFLTACYRTVRGPRVEHSSGRGALRAWKLGPRCRDCSGLLKRGTPAFRVATGWGSK